MPKRAKQLATADSASTLHDWLDHESSNHAHWAQAKNVLHEIAQSAQGADDLSGLARTSDMLARLIELVETQTPSESSPSSDLREILSFVQRQSQSVVDAINGKSSETHDFAETAQQIQDRWGECLQLLDDRPDEFGVNLGEMPKNSADVELQDEANLSSPSTSQVRMLLEAIGETSSEPVSAQRETADHSAPDARPGQACDQHSVAEICDDPDLRDAFLQDARGCLGAIEQNILSMEGQDDQAETLRRICRELHTLKGASASIGFRELATFLHDVEESIERRIDQGKPIGTDELLVAVDNVRGQVSWLEPNNSSAADSASATHAVATREIQSPVVDFADRDGQSSIRVRASKLDRLMDLLAELVVLRNRRETQVGELNNLNGELMQCAARLKQFADQLHDSSKSKTLAETFVRTAGSMDHLHNDVHEISRSRMVAEIASDLSEISRVFKDYYRPIGEENIALTHFIRQFRQEMMQLRRAPVSGLFNRLQRAARDAARAEQKQVQIQFIGHQIAIEQSLQETLYEPLLHIVRNAVSHGIESADKRKSTGKPALGHVSIHLTASANTLCIVVSDDGRGLDYDALRRKGYEYGLLSAERAPTQQEIAKLIFHSGLSTREAATEVSGRGIGMDVAATAIDRLHGRIEVESTPGRGTSMRLSIPLRSGIEHAMVFRVAGQLFALPMQSVSTAQSTINRADDRREQAQCPRWSFAQVAQLATGSTRLDACSLTLDIAAGSRGQANRIELQVDEIVGGEEVVVRALPRELRSHPFVNGVTLSGGGEMVLTIDPIRWSEICRVQSESASENSANVRREEMRAELKKVLVVDDSLSARRSLTKRLAKYGLESDEASDGLNALECLRSGSYQLIITDVDMPRLGGLELLGELHQRHLVETPVIVVSSRTDEPTRRRANRYGARAFLNKPVSDETLVDLLQQFHLIAH